SRSAMMPDPTTAANSRAVPTPSAMRLRLMPPVLVAAAGASGGRLWVELCDCRRPAAAGRETATRLAEFLECGAAAVNRRLAIGVEGFPRHALRVGDPLLVGSGVAAGRRLLFEHRTLGRGEPVIDLGELALIFGLNAEMRDAGTVPAAGADREIDAGVFQHPFRIIGFQNRGFGREQRRIEPNRLGQILNRDVN